MGSSQLAQWVKNLPAILEITGVAGSVSGLGRSPGEGHGNPLQYSCLESSMDRGARWARGGKESDTTEVTEHAGMQGRMSHLRIVSQSRLQLSRPWVSLSPCADPPPHDVYSGSGHVTARNFRWLWSRRVWGQ